MCVFFQMFYFRNNLFFKINYLIQKQKFVFCINNMDALTIIILIALILFFVFYCNKREEFVIIPPSLIRAHDGYNALGAIVDQGFETDIADYVAGQGPI